MYAIRSYYGLYAKKVSQVVRAVEFSKSYMSTGLKGDSICRWLPRAIPQFSRSGPAADQRRSSAVVGLVNTNYQQDLHDS